jgi:hypothetical protein
MIIKEAVEKLFLPPFAVIPAQAGIQSFHIFLDARFHGHDESVGH